MGNSPGDATSAAAAAIGPSEVPPQPQQQACEEQWYYVSASGRTGPVTLGSLHKLAADRHIDCDALVWKKGLPDWIPLSRYREGAENSISPELSQVSGNSSPNLYIWALALAPAWGTILQIIGTELWVVTVNNQLSYYAQLWWIMIAANVTASGLDSISLKKTGKDVTINKWMFLVVPAYIYLRDKRLSGHLRWFWVWIVSLLLSLTTFVYLNGIYAGLSAR